MSVGDVYRALWRHKYLIVVLTGALVAAAWFLTSRQQPQYTAASLVRIQQTINDPAEAFGALQAGGRLAQTYERIVRTSTIARKVHANLGGAVDYRQIDIGAAQVQDLELLM